MRQLKLALPLAILLFVASAEAASVQDFIAPYLLKNEQALTSEAVVGGQTYTIANLSGAYALVVRQEGQNYGLVQDAGVLQSVLGQRMLADMNLNGRLQAVRADVLAFNASRQPKEAQCKQYTGIDRHECIYNAGESEPALRVITCTTACRSVPICQTAISYNLDGIYNIFYFNNDTKHMDYLVGRELSSQQQVAGVVSSASADDALGVLAEMRATASRISSNKLSDPVILNFCPKVAFDMGRLSSAEAGLTALRADIRNYENANETAAAVLKTTLERINASRQKEEYLRLAGELSSRINMTKQAISQAQQVVNDSALSGSLEQADGLLIVLLGAIEEKSFATANNVLVQASAQVASVNASAYALAGRHYSALNLTYNCTSVAFNATILDNTPAGRGRAADAAGRLAAARERLARTPMQPADFAAADGEVKTACRDARELMASAAVQHYAQKEGAVREKIANAKASAQRNGASVDDKEVESLIYGAYSLLNQTGDVEGADALFLLADSKADALVETAKGARGAGVTAQEKIASARKKLADARSAPLLLIVKPDLKGPEATIASAERLLRSNPDAAGQLADKASADIDAAVNSATTTNIAIIAIGGGLVLVLIAGAALFVFVLRRKNKK